MTDEEVMEKGKQIAKSLAGLSYVQAKNVLHQAIAWLGFLSKVGEVCLRQSDS